MTYRFTALGFLFLALALVLAACEVLGVYEYVSEHKSSAYVALGSCVIAAITPTLPALADWFGRGRQFRYCLATWLAFILCLMLVMTAAIQRTGSTTDTAQQSREAAERAAKIAVAAETQAASDYEAAQAAALKECVVRRTRCMDAEEKADKARAALAKARAALISAPASEQVDPLARRIASVLPVSEERVRLLQPLLLPIILSLLSAVLFAGWSRLDFIDAAEPPNLAPDARDVPQPSGGGIRPKAPPVPAAPASVAEFLADVLEGDPKGEIEVPVLYTTFKSWCRKKGRGLLEGPAFVNELNDVRQRVGIDIEARGKRVYCIGVRLAA